MPSSPKPAWVFPGPAVEHEIAVEAKPVSLINVGSLRNDRRPIHSTWLSLKGKRGPSRWGP